MVPRTLEAWVKARTRVRGPMMPAAASRSRAPASSTGMNRRVAPVRAASSCHGIRLAWCSISVTTISSPGARAKRRGFGRRAGQGRVQERVGEQVQALGGVGGPDRARPAPRPTKARDGFPGVFERLGGLDGEVVRAAVDGGVPLLVELLLGLEHAERVLRGRSGVQVDQLFAVDLLLQDREVVADPEDLIVSERDGRAAKVGWGGNHGGDSWIGVRCGAPPAGRRRTEIRHTDST